MDLKLDMHQKDKLIERMARRLHYIDYFYEQRPVNTDWDLLEQKQHNKYLNYSRQVLKIIEET